jgi:thioesterase domain-containing protein/acyl carrier protein
MHWTEILEQPYDAVEVAVRKAWEDVLATGSIGASDDFYSLGGDSFAATRILARLSDRFDLDLPISAFLSAPTIHRLAEVIRSRTPAERSALIPIQPLQPNVARLPVFLVAGAGGYGSYFARLSRYLGARQPVFSLQAAELPHRASISGIAEQFIMALETVGHEGPVLLGGYSAGGVIVFEMAQQLSRAGREVGLVALFDTSFPPGRVDDEFDIEILLEHARLAGLTMESDTLRAVDPDERVDLLARAAENVRSVGLDVDRIRWWLQWVRDNVFIASMYCPDPYDGELVLFRCTDRSVAIDEAADDDRIGRWADVSSRLTVVPVPGTHGTMFKEPAVPGVAAALQRFLERANQ